MKQKQVPTFDEFCNESSKDEETNEAVKVKYPKTVTNYAGLFNSTLAAIGGNTANFMNHDGMIKLYGIDKDFFESKEVVAIIKEIIKAREDWGKLEDEYQKKGGELRHKFEGLLKDKFGTSNLYQITK